MLPTFGLHLVSGGSRGSSTRGSGGGSPTTISSGTFAGRMIGGGTREQVYGNQRYGSGYTYGGGPSVAGRGFPFGYWPVFFPAGAGLLYYGYAEYGPASNSSRPGGVMKQALVRSVDWPPPEQGGNSSDTASYYIIGDADTIAVVMDELVKSKTCPVANATASAVEVVSSLKLCRQFTISKKSSRKTTLLFD